MRVRQANSSNLEEQKKFEKLLLDFGNCPYPMIDDYIQLPDVLHESQILLSADSVQDKENIGLYHRILK